MHQILEFAPSEMFRTRGPNLSPIDSTSDRARCDDLFAPISAISYGQRR